MYIYNNLTDSVGFNYSTTNKRSLSYLPIEIKDGTYAKQKANQLKTELTELSKFSSENVIVFSLNQISDNPIFYKATLEEQKKQHEEQKKELEEQKKELEEQKKELEEQKKELEEQIKKQKATEEKPTTKKRRTASKKLAKLEKQTNQLKEQITQHEKKITQHNGNITQLEKKIQKKSSSFGEPIADLSKQLFELLLKLLKQQKALISTYNGNNNVIEYAKHSLALSFERIFSYSNRRVRPSYVSSLFATIAIIDNDKNPNFHYSNVKKRDAYRFLLGEGSEKVTILDGIVYNNNYPQFKTDIATIYNEKKMKEAKQIYSNIFGTSALFPKFIEKAGVMTPRQYLDNEAEKYGDGEDNHEKCGYYTGLYSNLEDKDISHSDTYKLQFLTRIREINNMARDMNAYKPNDKFISENHISLTNILSRIVHTEIMGQNILEQIYIETIDQRLEELFEEKGNNVKQKFLEKSKYIFDILAKSEHFTRSDMYERILQMIETYIKPIIITHEIFTINDYDKYTKRRLIVPFFFQTIDFAYNYFNFLQTLGLRDDAIFEFYFYYTNDGKFLPCNPTRSGKISLSNEFSNEIFKVVYNVYADDRKIGSYIKFEYAVEVKDVWKNKGYSCYIKDRNGDIISS